MSRLHIHTHTYTCVSSQVLGALLAADDDLSLCRGSLPLLVASARDPRQHNDSHAHTGCHGALGNVSGATVERLRSAGVHSGDEFPPQGGGVSVSGEMVTFDEGASGVSTRVRALMALRYLLLDHQSGEKAIRVCGDEVLCAILSALQSAAWPVRNAAHLALGAALERTMGRELARRPRTRAFFGAFPEFSRALVRLLARAGVPQAQGSGGRETRSLEEGVMRGSEDEKAGAFLAAAGSESAVLAALCVVRRLSPCVDGSRSEAEREAHVLGSEVEQGVWKACQALGGHSSKAIRRAAAHAALCVAPGDPVDTCALDRLAVEISSLVHGAWSNGASQVCRLDSRVYQLQLLLSDPAVAAESGSGAAQARTRGEGGGTRAAAGSAANMEQV